MIYAHKYQFANIASRNQTLIERMNLIENHLKKMRILQKIGDMHDYIVLRLNRDNLV